MRKQNVLAKARSRAGRDGVRGNAGEQLGKPKRLRCGGQRHQAGQRLGDAQAEAARHVMGKASGAHFRDRQAAGRQDQRRRGEASVTGLQLEAAVA